MVYFSLKPGKCELLVALPITLTFCLSQSKGPSLNLNHNLLYNLLIYLNFDVNYLPGKKLSDMITLWEDR